MSSERRPHPSNDDVPEHLDDAAPRLPWDGQRVERGPGPYSRWPATPEGVTAAGNEVGRRARDAGASDALVDDISVAVSEACMNAVLHAYVTAHRAAETFAVSTAASGGTFAVWVTDGGRGATPTASRGGGGTGLAVMGALSETLDVGTLVGGGTQVHMTFSIGALRSPAVANHDSAQPDRASGNGWAFDGLSPEDHATVALVAALRETGDVRPLVAVLVDGGAGHAQAQAALRTLGELDIQALVQVAMKALWRHAGCGRTLDTRPETSTASPG
jgi:anti-sigma regulatory factor (Ser/Thr protein kinase)